MVYSTSCSIKETISTSSKFFRFSLLFLFFSIFVINRAEAQNTVFKSGSAIIDMGGAGTPTVANSLKPYGLIYALLNGYNVPVYGVIGQNKVKDGIDFTYGAKSYKGGTYVISAEFLSPDVKTLLNSWAAQGVIIDYTTSDLTVNVTYKISFAPKWVMDKTNGNIAVTYLNSAGIPASAYSFKEPSQLGDCDDIFVLPHASPSWNTHNNLYFFNKNKGAIYVSCSAGSALEALYKDTTINGVAQRIQMNFLTTTGLVPASTHKAAVTPFVHQFPTDPIAQYMGITDGAQLKGAEVVYLPKKGGTWNTNAKIITKSPTQPDIPTLSDGPAAINVYGRGFDDPTRGYVFYEAAHSVSGTTPDFIAAQRMFFNFSFFALGERSKSSFTVTLNNNATPAASTVPPQMRGTIAATGLTATVSLPGTYKYEWKSSVPGTFTPSATISSTTLTATTVTFTPADVNSNTQAVITCVVTDANCTRSAFDSKGTVVVPSMPTLNSAALTYSAKSDCANNTLAINVFQDVVDANAGSRTLTVTTSPSNGTITVDASAGIVNYTPNANFQGTETLNYTISNGGVSSPASNTITINVGNAAIAPKLTNDTYTGILENQLTTLRVLDNDKNNLSATTNSKLFVRNIVTKPVKGYVYINNDGTISYVSKKNTSSADYTETFTYQACNDQGYCSIATVSVSVIDCGCADDLYKTGVSTSSSSGTLTLTAISDSYIDANNTSTNNGSASSLYLSSRSGSSSRIRYPLFKFDITGIPSGSTISSALLKTYLSSTADLSANSSANPFPASIYPLKQNWTETGVSWKNYKSSTAWLKSGVLNTSASDDYYQINTPPTFSSPGTNASTAAGTLVQSDIASIVRGWMNGTYTNNYGVIVFPTVSSNSTNVYFASKENSTQSYRPVLVVSYTTTGNTVSCINIPSNYKPITYLDNVTTPSNTNLSISPLTNDANYYGRTNSISSITQPSHGSATKSGTVITYVPDGSFVGVDSLTYTVSDGTSTNTAVIRIDVTRVAPKINRDNATTPSATNILINVAANDTDPQGAIDVPIISTFPKYGTATISGNSISYTPNTGYVGNDTLVYSRASVAVAGSCSLPLSDTALVVITMTNRAPIAGNDNITATSCKPIEMDLLSNDSDPEGTPLSILIVANPTHGTIALDASGKYIYTSSSNYVGSDQFTYYVKDGSSDQLSSTTATVNITVNASGTNHAPTAVNDTDNTVVNQDVSTDVIANDSDQDGDAISINISASGLQAPAHGTIQLLGNGQISYTPNANFTGTDSYQYQVCDNNVSCSGSNGSLCSIGTVTITIQALPILISGTVWNDIDKSANNTFNSIRNGAEIGSNAFNGLYAHLVDANNNVLDQAPISYDGTYIFTNAPSNASNLKIVINSQLFALGSVVSAGTLPNGFAATTPSITSSFSTSTVNITGQDFGINQLPTASSFTFAEQTNPAPSSLTVNTAKVSGTDQDGSIAGYRFTSFPANVSSITINSITYTSTSWPGSGVTVGTSSLTISVIPNAGTVSPTIKYVSRDNAGFETATEASLILPLYIQLTGGEISLSAGTSSATISYCGPSIPGQMYSKVDPAGGRGTILYQWEKSTDGTTWADKVGATSINYAPTLAVDVTTYYRRKSYTSIDNAVYSNTITITINTLPTITSTIAGSRSGTGVVSVYAEPSSGATIDWYTSLSGGTTVSSANYTYTTPSISTSTLYYAAARDLTTSCLSNARTAVLAEVVGTLNAGVIGSDQSQCGPATPDLLESVVDATAGTSTVTYQWQSSTNNITFSNITGATDLTYQAGTITSTSYFRRVATASISGTPTSTNSNVITVTINPLPSLPIAVNKARTGVGSVDLSATTTSGITVDWYDDNALTNVLATGSNNYTTPQIADTTSYFVVARNISTGCVSGTTEVVAIVNEAFTAGLIDGPSGVCINGTPSIINSASLAHGGTTDLTGATLGTYSYQWEASTTSTSAGFSPITGATSTTYQPGTLTSTTFYRRKVTTPNDPAVYSNVVTINVNALPVVATIANSSICSGSGITLTTTGASTYSWSPSSGLSATNIAAPTASPSTTTTYTVTGVDANGCSNTSSTTITVNALPSITLGSTSSVNSSATSFNLPYTSTTGSPNQYSISVTTPNALTGFTALSNATLGSSPISVTIPASVAGVYNFNINVRNSVTGCVSTNVGFTQTINVAAPASLSYNTPNVYTLGGGAITALNPTSTGGTITQYTIGPSLPAGLSINPTTGVISGTPTAASGQTTYTVTGTNSTGSVTATIVITVNGVQNITLPQGGISAVDFKLFASDTVKLKVDITAGTSPYTLIISNNKNTTKDTISSVTNGAILNLKSTSSNTIYTLFKITDNGGSVRSSGFTKDTTGVTIVAPNIALTLKADKAVKQSDNSFKTKLLLKIKNSGQIDLKNVQVNANLSEVFPKDIAYKLDSVKLVNGNIRLSSNYQGNGTSTTASSVKKGITASAGIVSNAVLDANYLFDNGVNLAINEEADVDFYLSIAPTTSSVVLKLQFSSAGDGVLPKSGGYISQQSSTAVSDDGTNLATHPNNTNVGTPNPTYLPLFPVEVIGAALKASNPTPVTGGYTFDFVAKAKSLSNMNLDTVAIFNDFSKTFTSPDTAYIVGTPVVTGSAIFNTNFNGYSNTLLIDSTAQLAVGDSITVSYTLFVGTTKTSGSWSNSITASGHSSVDYNYVWDISTDGTNPDPNGDGDTKEQGKTYFYINYTPPAPPKVENKTYVFGTPIPSTIENLVKEKPAGTIPVWCDVQTAICSPNAPATPTIIGKYYYQLKSYDTTTKLYSIAYVNDTVIIKPPVPIVNDSTYIIGVANNPANVGVQVKAMTGGSLKYFLKTILLNAVPGLGNAPGTVSYTVSQVVNQIESDTASFKVTLLHPNDVMHLQKIAGEAVLQSNSSFNIPFTFIARNVLNKQLDSVLITDNLMNSIASPGTFSVVSLSGSGGLITNTNFNGKTDINVTTYASKLIANAIDTIKLVINVIPNGYSGVLQNTAILNAKTPYGKLSMNSSSKAWSSSDITKTPTPFTIPDLRIDIPEGFSPNRDGVNDKFVIIKPYGTILELEVFNRWGNIVYTNSNYNNEWDGRGTNNFLGQELLDGGYYYTLKAKSPNGNVQIFKGFVLIQR